MLDSVLEEAVEGHEKLEEAWDKASEALINLQIKLVLHEEDDEDEDEVALTNAWDELYDWEGEDDFKPEQDGLDVISYDEFVEDWVDWSRGNGDPNDVVDRISARSMDLQTALDALAYEIPMTVGRDVEDALNQVYTSAESLEELLLG